MANMLSMMKQATQMRREMKNLQSELEKKTSEYSNGGVTVVARGDMTLVSIRLDPEAVAAMPGERLERLLLQNVNNALKKVKKEAQQSMSALASSTGLGELLGGGS